MHHARRRVPARLVRTFLVGLTAAALAVAGAPALPAAAQGSAAQAQGTYTKIRAHHTVDVRTLPPARPVGPQLKARAAPPPVTPSGPARPVTVVDRGAPVAAGAGPTAPAPAAATAPVRQLKEFAAAGFDGPTPPDTTAGVGATDVMEMVNSTWHRFDKQGVQQDSGNTSTFFGAPVIAMTTPFFSDARVVYDALSGRFYASVLIFDACKPANCSPNTAQSNSEVDVAVSGSNSATNWKVYTVETTTNGTLLDQPKLGFSNDKVVMTYNENGFGGPFRFVVLQKSDLLAQANSVATFRFNLDNNHFNVIPAISLTGTDTEFAMSANRGSSTLTVFQFTGTPAANNVASSTTDLGIGTINDPPAADQKSDTRQLDTGVAGVQSVAFQNGVLEGAGNDTCTPPNDTTTRSCLRFDRVSTSGGISLVQDVDLGQTGAHLFYPAVTFDSAGNLWVGHSVSSTTQFASAGETFVAGGVLPTTVPGIDYQLGVGPYNCTFCTAANGDARNRFGDFSAAAQDPADPDDIWVAEEWASTSTTNTDSWGTAIARFTVAPATTTAVTSSVNPTVFGQSTTFSVTVTPVAPATGTPTGTVAIASDGGALGTVGLVNGQASLTTSALGAGTHVISAAYSGDSTFDDSTGALIQSVSQAATITSIASSIDPSTFGQDVTFTATVTAKPPGGGTPTGTVDFSSDGSPLGTVALASGQAILTTSALLAGNHTIAAAYNGDGNFLTSHGTVLQVVNPSATTTTITPSANPSTFGQPVGFTANVAAVPPGAGIPTGSVTFTADSAPFGAPAALSGGQATSIPISSLGPGTHTIVAAYGGDPNFLTSSGTVSQKVTCQVNISGTVTGVLTVTKSTCVDNATIIGGIVVQPGGALALTGSQVSGSLKATGATGVRLCGDGLHGPATIADSTGFVLAGDAGDDGTVGCSGSSMQSLTLTNNHAGAEIGGNTLSASLTMNGTTGAGPTLEDASPEVEANHVGAGLACAGNTTAPTNGGQPNTVNGGRTGQCSAAGF
jgi:hypothetical protein